MNSIILKDKQISNVNLQSRRDLNLTSGDTVRVSQKIIEKGKMRVQLFEGIIIAAKHGKEAGATFTVRRVGTDKIGIEKTYPLYSPLIDKIEVMKRTKTRRARLYFLREKTRKEVKDKLRNSVFVKDATVSEMQEEKLRAEEKAKQEESKMNEEKKKTEETQKTESKTTDSDKPNVCPVSNA